MLKQTTQIQGTNPDLLRTSSEVEEKKADLKLVPLDEKKQRLAMEIARAQIYKNDIMADPEVIETLISKEAMGGTCYIYFNNIRIFSSDATKEELKKEKFSPGK